MGRNSTRIVRQLAGHEKLDYLIRWEWWICSTLFCSRTTVTVTTLPNGQSTVDLFFSDERHTATPHLVSIRHTPVAPGLRPPNSLAALCLPARLPARHSNFPHLPFLPHYTTLPYYTSTSSPASLYLASPSSISLSCRSTSAEKYSTSGTVQRAPHL